MQNIVVLLLVIGSTADGSTGADATTPSRTRTAWITDVSDALRRQATAQDIDQPQLIMDLITLFHQVHADRSLNTSDRNRLRDKLRVRLLRLSQQFSRDVELRQAKIKTVSRRAELAKQPDLLEKTHDDQLVLDRWRQVLAQVGAAGQGGAGGRPAGAASDYGDDLVELIQTVISPESWDVNGGPMAIVYYRNRQALVVSATTEVHEQIGGLAEAMRRVGN